MTLKGSIIDKIIQSQKHTYHLAPFIRHSGIDKNIGITHISDYHMLKVKGERFGVMEWFCVLVMLVTTRFCTWLKFIDLYISNNNDSVIKANDLKVLKQETNDNFNSDDRMVLGW